MSQNGQTLFKYLTAFPSRFLKCVWPFGTLCVKVLDKELYTFKSAVGTSLKLAVEKCKFITFKFKHLIKKIMNLHLNSYFYIPEEKKWVLVYIILIHGIKSAFKEPLMFVWYWSFKVRRLLEGGTYFKLSRFIRIKFDHSTFCSSK